MPSVEMQILSELKKHTKLLEQLVSQRQSSAESKQKFFKNRMETPRFASVDEGPTTLTNRITAASDAMAIDDRTNPRLGDILSMDEVFECRAWVATQPEIAMRGGYDMAKGWYDTLPENEDGTSEKTT